MKTRAEIVENLLKLGRIGWALDPRVGKEVVVEHATGCAVQGDGVPAPRMPQIRHPRETRFTPTEYRSEGGFFEGFVQYMYLDCAGEATVGIGHRIKNAEAAKSLPFYMPDEPGGKTEKATPEDKEKAFNKVLGSKLICKDPEMVFKNMTDPRLSIDTIETLFDNDVDEFIHQLTHDFPEFGAYPKMAQLGMLDLLFNIGYKEFIGTKKESKFENFKKALSFRNWIGAAEESHREEKNKNDDIMSGMVNRNMVVQTWFLQAIKDEPFFVNPNCLPKNVPMVRGYTS